MKEPADVPVVGPCVPDRAVREPGKSEAKPSTSSGSFLMQWYALPVPIGPVVPRDPPAVEGPPLSCTAFVYRSDRAASECDERIKFFHEYFVEHLGEHQHRPFVARWPE